MTIGPMAVVNEQRRSTDDESQVIRAGQVVQVLTRLQVAVNGLVVAHGQVMVNRQVGEACPKRYTFREAPG